MSILFNGGAFPSLPKVYKNRYSFRLSVPSFIYPAGWADNARLLGPYVDEIELLFFESKTDDCLPSKGEVDDLVRIAKDSSLGYNIHLPTDISPAATGKMELIEAVDAIRRVVDRTYRITPTNWILHIHFDPLESTDDEIIRWRERARAVLEKVIDDGIPSRLLAIENLDYPFERVLDLVKDLNLRICMDVGHLLIRGEDIGAFYRANEKRVATIHLHGARDGKDHLPLTVLSKAEGALIKNTLRNFSGTLSLEVFSYDDLVPSLEWLDMAFSR